jgi:membrane-bound lytic murein transglycosylase B
VLLTGGVVRAVLGVGLVLVSGVGVSAESFDACLVRLQALAVAEGVSVETVEAVVPGLAYRERVIELDRAQPEVQQSFSAYLSSRVNTRRVAHGRWVLLQNAELLEELTRRHGVPGRYLVALWGLETDFGRYLGSMPTLDSLATLACDPRRADFFSRELVTALKLIDRDGLSPERMRGSWAGAMGHMQFMPTTWEAHAVDGDGSGDIDLWSSTADALASAAAYLQSLGWQSGERWGREVRLPEDFDYLQTGIEQTRSVNQWGQLGVMTSNGAALPRSDLEAALLVPMGRTGPAFLVYDNFRVLMEWNRSKSYALAVGYLADRIAGAGTLAAPLPERSLPPVAEVLRLQQRLAELGFEPGEPDGLFGPATRRALREFQNDQGMVADGFPDAATIQALLQAD